MDKIIRRIYILVLFLGIGYMVYALMIGRNTIVSHVEATATRQLVPYETQTKPDGTHEFLLQTDEQDDRVSMAIQFLSSHQYVEVYDGDSLLYSVTAEPSLFGHTTGTGINFVLLPVDARLIRVCITPVFAGSSTSEPVFYYGDALAMYRSVIRSSIPDAVMSLVIIILGAFMILYWLITRKRIGQSPAVLYFGIFSAMIGLWSLNETNLMMVLCVNRIVWSVVGYMMLMLLTVPFIQFVRFFLEIKNPRVCNMLCLSYCILTVVLTVLHMTDVWEFKKSVWVIHLMMLLGLSYMIAALAVHVRREGFDHKARTNLIAFVLLAVSIVADFIAYYMGLQQTDILGKIGILAYILLLGRESASDALEKVDEGRKAEVYRTLAITDVMTGLLNRSAFEEWEAQCEPEKNMVLVTFDLNNLKHCNDTFGHAAGDTYIIDAAKMIRHVFGTVGKCYRIGGDEFCVVIADGRHLDLKRYLTKLRRQQEEYNRENSEVKIHIAVGYAAYGEEHTNIEDVRSRADTYMYRNKKQMKEEEV
ncbi:MAG: GGDEF domain-containing protein [Agathobacter sp.]|nr:GGDEF domain-containing protein [Agathobacter sp.]